MGLYYVCVFNTWNGSCLNSFISGNTFDRPNNSPFPKSINLTNTVYKTSLKSITRTATDNTHSHHQSTLQSYLYTTGYQMNRVPYRNHQPQRTHQQKYNPCWHTIYTKKRTQLCLTTNILSWQVVNTYSCV